MSEELQTALDYLSTALQALHNLEEALNDLGGALEALAPLKLTSGGPFGPWSDE